MATQIALNPSSLIGLKQSAEAQYFTMDTAKEWFSLIEDGVPDDVALKRLEAEVNSPDSPTEYKGCYEESDDGTVFTSLTKAEYMVIMMYCTEGEQFYLRLNEDLRKRNWKKYVVYTSLLHSVCTKLRNMPMEKTNPNHHLFRGLRCGSINCPGSEFCWPGFTSATPEREIAEEFASTIITLQSEIGAPVRRFSCFFEYEVLFSPFFLFKVEQHQTSVIYRSLPEKSNFFISSPFYRGALLGAAVGNCLGMPFEFQGNPTIQVLLKFFTELEKSKVKGKLSYSCDTSTSFALAKSLIEKNGLDVRNMKDSLVNEYVNDPSRNYGASVATILTELKKKGPQDDVYGPAQRQFNGSGSHGNGGAMRVTPAALFFYKQPRIQIKNKVSKITRLTHANVNGINGAILQASAVQMALRLALEGAWEKDIRQEFLKYLLEIMREVERNQAVYSEKLKKIQGYLRVPPTVEKIRSDLGTGMSAAESVPAAIYCFIRGLKPIESIPEKYNAFERTIIYAISLGGDTDTIASMAGAIAGAYYGQDAVTQRLRDACETKAIEGAKQYAKQIHNLVWK